MAKQILALHNGRAKKIYLCTQNLKNILVWSAPTGPRNVFAKSKVKQARFYMSKALTHEAVHAAQYCNNNNLIAPERSSSVGSLDSLEFDAHFGTEQYPQVSSGSVVTHHTPSGSSSGFLQ